MNGYMMTYQHLLTEWINAGAFDENTVGDISYRYLKALLEVCRMVPNGKHSYLAVKNYFEKINIGRLKKQDKITVAFIPKDDAAWMGDELYHLLERSGRFEPYLLLLPKYGVGTISDVIRQYMKEFSYFVARGLRVVHAMDVRTGRQLSWREIGARPDICIWFSQWEGQCWDNLSLLEYPMSTMHMFIPYGLSSVENTEGTFTPMTFDYDLQNMCVRIFEPARMFADMAEKYAFVGSSNAVYTGYPKMDAFFEAGDGIGDEVWSRLEGKSGTCHPKRVIYAPHHTVGDYGVIHMSTFASNHQMMLDLAKKYGSETVWVFKPHPELRLGTVGSGLFADADAWDAYVQQWRDLPNAEVMDSGSYAGLFLGSDAMITDCVSFLTEYLYAHKPLLQLTRDDSRYNEFGEEMVRCHYRVAGGDAEGIEAFLNDVVIGGRDEKRGEREAFFEKHLDYRKLGGKSAAGNIYAEILKMLEA